MKNNLSKSLWRSVRQSKGRFIAIVLIVMLGVLLFVGIKAVSPDLYGSADRYISAQKLNDVRLVSTAGLTKADVQRVKKVSGAQVQAERSLYILDQKRSDVAQIFAYSARDQQNQLKLKSGHLPRRSDEIVLDQLAKSKGYQLGDTYRVKSSGLKTKSYRVVGFVTSPLFVDDEERGSANIGDGSVAYFAYVPATNFKSNVYTALSVRFSKLQAESSFSSAYKQQAQRKLTAVKKALRGRATARQTSLKQTALVQINGQQQQLDQQKAQLTQATDAATATQQLAPAQAKITVARKQANAIERPTYTYTKRAGNPGFQGYGDMTTRIAAIANVFPLFFFLIAGLITFTTMTRMIEEDRSQIGTLKALGYTKWEIARNYLLYGIVAALLGTVLGVVIGVNTIPLIVFKAMTQYIYTAVVLDYPWTAVGLATLFSFFVTLGAVIIVLTKELSEKPAALMLPKAPKAGKRILLERVGFIWRRLSFNQKVSYRNLFRFKSRMWMGIIGIAGGTALIMTGFGIRDSISQSGINQFEQIMHYQAVVSLNTDAKNVTKTLAQNPRYQQSLGLYTDMISVSTAQEKVSEVSLDATDQTQTFKRYVSLTTNLPARGVVLSDKLAKLLDVQTGDTVTVTNSDNQTAQVKVRGITSNYAGHFAYMNKATLNRLFSGRYQVNTRLVKTQPQTVKQENAYAKKLMGSDKVVHTEFISKQKRAINQEAAKLNPILWIFIFLSGLLTFVVLYNLTNINVSERIRELSTIKVLGFFDLEVTNYIVRENVVLTLFGIVVGYGLGNLLTAFILRQAATSTVIFPLTIGWSGYVVAALMTIVFTVIVMVVTHFRLKRVDMISALAAKE
ncbi:ABC transporter permease [Loigolactobacillus jiayinensis]|uniref:ABC transporter permease n=1 Tax=Loigolactobacillus jiayinensis TaxID=2486016 RepID=A0ABW1R9Z3_9LACO|nr:ABC transporter permease [Loigolactobacillus jiayinensis]